MILACLKKLLGLIEKLDTIGRHLADTNILSCGIACTHCTGAGYFGLIRLEIEDDFYKKILVQGKYRRNCSID